MARTAADILVERLANWGVEVVFGFPATALTGNRIFAHKARANSLYSSQA
ncbi:MULTISPECIES: hypothetical protein [Nitrosomonas]|uniref:Thiamine pyrophosphate enzyme N-terminal TPP-binding domain-containing protein n=1 Tax=Nitrosomonas communis TaxID=44574 RepID=A0A5D3YC98_9PROT|nr:MULTISPECIES: hypothetical protein [Nitrosomonas]TYP78429.1 hypothetical protein BCL69_107311 [Nitrosomonas communis]UVS60009.1 hypothetical protein NX761_10685 [Nitrosomonas sp. PLL12]